MKYYLYRLLPPRPNFPASMTPDEMDIMRAHGAYWTALMQQGSVAAFGPVADPAGAYGIAIIELDDTSDPAPLAAGDPAITANVGFGSELHVIPRMVLRSDMQRGP